MLSATMTGRSTAGGIPEEVVLERVRSALLGMDDPQLHGVRVSGEGEFVFLRGAVTTYYQKQLAQEVVMQVKGVKKLKNEIVVR